MCVCVCVCVYVYVYVYDICRHIVKSNFINDNELLRKSNHHGNMKR